MTIWGLGVIISFIFLMKIADRCMKKDGTEDLWATSYLCCLFLAVVFSWFAMIIGLILKGIRND